MSPAPGWSTGTGYGCPVGGEDVLQSGEEGPQAVFGVDEGDRAGAGSVTGFCPCRAGCALSAYGQRPDAAERNRVSAGQAGFSAPYLWPAFMPLDEIRVGEFQLVPVGQVDVLQEHSEVVKAVAVPRIRSSMDTLRPPVSDGGQMIRLRSDVARALPVAGSPASRAGMGGSQVRRAWVTQRPVCVPRTLRTTVCAGSAAWSSPGGPGVSERNAIYGMKHKSPHGAVLLNAGYPGSCSSR
jgi:hypothetical protein